MPAVESWCRAPRRERSFDVALVIYDRELSVPARAPNNSSTILGRSTTLQRAVDIEVPQIDIFEDG